MEMSTNLTSIGRAKLSKQERCNAEEWSNYSGSDTSQDDDAAKLANEMRKKVVQSLFDASLVTSDSILRPKKDENRDGPVSIASIYRK